MIRASAIQVTLNGKEPFVVEGYRHCYCFETIYDMGIRRPFDEVQGFVTDDGEFLNRIEAKKHAVECGQIKEGEGLYAELYSEDLW